ncbi:hypothetical protein LJK87_33840 [Paenibacillus sp. P25]|nr:hypothetical protein LJK87_33840 [Paenibacillus sp. P25]
MQTLAVRQQVREQMQVQAALWLVARRTALKAPQATRVLTERLEQQARRLAARMEQRQGLALMERVLTAWAARKLQALTGRLE